MRKALVFLATQLRYFRLCAVGSATKRAKQNQFFSYVSAAGEQFCWQRAGGLRQDGRIELGGVFHRPDDSRLARRQRPRDSPAISTN